MTTSHLQGDLGLMFRHIQYVQDNLYTLNPGNTIFVQNSGKHVRESDSIHKIPHKNTNGQQRTFRVLSKMKASFEQGWQRVQISSLTKKIRQKLKKTNLIDKVI